MKIRRTTAEVLIEVNFKSLSVKTMVENPKTLSEKERELVMYICNNLE